MNIGRKVRIMKAKNPGISGIRGIIVDETRNTLTLRTDRGDKTIIKEQVEEMR